MKKRITLEASNIYSGGGLVLLKLLLKELSLLSLDVEIYLGYDRVIKDIESESFNNLKIIKTTTKQTFLRFLKRREDIVYLCNLPPFVKNKNSYLVFYNELFFKKKNLLSKSGLKFALYNLWFRLFNKNVNNVLVQSVHMEDLIKSKTSCTNVLNIPIYKKFDKTVNVEKEYDFCYISSAAPHKNHLKLLKALSILLEKGIKTNMVVTIPDNENAKPINEEINRINRKYPKTIVNVGYIDNSEIEKIYAKSRALVFPSVAEAFGMPLIEAHDLGLKVLSSNLPYTFDVFEKVETFNPNEPISIANKMEEFLLEKLNKSEQISKVENKLDSFVAILTKDEYAI